MKETFRGRWSKINDCEIDKVSNLIVTGINAKEAEPAPWIPEFLGDNEKSLTVLDFGCGFGRNAIWLAKTFPHWTVFGYDSEQMIARVPEYAAIKYGGVLPENLWFISDWEQLKFYRFDKIMCILVLQHIFEEDLKRYLVDFKKMTPYLLVHGRRYNDGPDKKSTWKILEENGYVPTKFYRGHEEIPFAAEGDLSEHNAAKFLLQ